MPVPLLYPQGTKGSFNTPRTPPLPPKYSPPVLSRSKSAMGYPESRRGNRLAWMSDTVRNHVIAVVGEFVGTTFFLFFALAAAQTANAKPDNLPAAGAVSMPGSLSLLQILYISFGFGLSLAVNAWVFFRISGGMFNPAVTIALWLAGALPVIRATLLIPVQIAGGILASIMVSGLFPGPMKVQTSLGDGTSVNQGLFIEMFLTAELIFTILMLAVEKHRATPMAPVGIGAALFLGHVIGINWTGASLNPARTFGPSVILGEFVPYHWIYWLGPILGGILAAAFYKFIKYLEYETSNPGQDDDGIPFYRVVTNHQHPNRRSNSVSSLKPFAQAGV